MKRNNLISSIQKRELEFKHEYIVSLNEALNPYGEYLSLNEQLLAIVINNRGRFPRHFKLLADHWRTSSLKEFLEENYEISIDHINRVEDWETAGAIFEIVRK